MAQPRPRIVPVKCEKVNRRGGTQLDPDTIVTGPMQDPYTPPCDPTESDRIHRESAAGPPASLALRRDETPPSEFDDDRRPCSPPLNLAGGHRGSGSGRNPSRHRLVRSEPRRNVLGKIDRGDVHQDPTGVYVVVASLMEGVDEEMRLRSVVARVVNLDSPTTVTGTLAARLAENRSQFVSTEMSLRRPTDPIFGALDFGEVLPTVPLPLAPQFGGHRLLALHAEDDDALPSLGSRARSTTTAAHQRLIRFGHDCDRNTKVRPVAARFTETEDVP